MLANPREHTNVNFGRQAVDGRLVLFNPAHARVYIQAGIAFARALTDSARFGRIAKRCPQVAIWNRAEAVFFRGPFRRYRRLPRTPFRDL
jgi:hypothetical protein